jgi:hypothetical protein
MFRSFRRQLRVGRARQRFSFAVLRMSPDVAKHYLPMIVYVDRR